MKEQRVAKHLEDAGAAVMQVTIPPKDFFNRQIYQFGGERFYKRIIVIDFDEDAEFSDEIAEEIGQLPNLLHLSLSGISVSDSQVASIARCRTLNSLKVHLRSRWRDSNDFRLTDLVLGAGLLNDGLKQFGVNDSSVAVDDWMKQRMGIAMANQNVPPVAKEEATKPNDIVRPTDEGLLAFEGHPSLRELSICGCNVSDDVLRKVLISLQANDEDEAANQAVDAIVADRRRREFVLAGSVIQVDSQEDFPADATRQLSDGPLANERAGVVRITLQDSLVDFERLNFVLDENLKWELVVTRFVPLGGAGSFRLTNFMEELAPYKDRVTSLATDRLPELLNVISELPNLRSVTIAGETNESLLEHLECFAAIRRLQGLGISQAYIFDDQVHLLAKLKQLKTLALHRAAFTSVGLQELMESGLQLEELSLPAYYKGSESKILASGLAKKVRCIFPSPFMSKRTVSITPFYSTTNLNVGSDVISRTTQALKHAKFPRPGDSQRPEDGILYAERAAILEDCVPGRGAPSIDSLIDSLRATLQRTGELDVPIEKLAMNPPTMVPNTGKAELLHGNVGSQAKQVSMLFESLARLYERKRDFDRSLEMRVRQLAWFGSVPNYVRLADMLGLNSDTPQEHKLSHLFFLEVSAIDGEVTVEQPRTTMVCDWYSSHPQGVPILLPPGKRVAVVSLRSPLSDAKPMEVTAMPRYFEGKPISIVRDSSRSQEIEIPVGNELIFVERKHFPLKIFLSEPEPEEVSQ